MMTPQQIRKRRNDSQSPETITSSLPHDYYSNKLEPAAVGTAFAQAIGIGLSRESPPRQNIGNAHQAAGWI
jgi:hypothetical protein